MCGFRLSVALLGLLGALAVAPGVAQAAELGHLRGLAGEYTNVLLNDPALDAELRTLLGGDYDSFMSVMQVVLPTTLIEGRFLVAEGCRAHDCSNHGGLIVIDLDAGQVVALRRGMYGFAFAVPPDLEAILAGWLTMQ